MITPNFYSRSKPIEYTRDKKQKNLPEKFPEDFFV